ncbi:hypothetical protein JCM10213v2_002055 [Rhodosporidiobolus nylandii]
MSVNESSAIFPSAIHSLNQALEALPHSVTSANLTLLSSLLTSLAADLAPSFGALSELQKETLLSNTTYLFANLDQLSTLTAQIPSPDLVSAPSPADAVAIIQAGATRYDVMTFWAPEVWAILGIFAVAAALKVAMEAMCRKKAVERCRETLQTREQREVDRARAADVLRKPAKAALGHLLNLITATFALVLQCLAWRLFVLPQTPLRMNDIIFLSCAMKLLLVGYGCELLFSDLRPEIFLHHFFTFALLFVGQLAAHQTGSPKFFRLAQYLILQATTEQTTYLSMFLYHLSTFFRLQSHRPRVQRRLLFCAWELLRFTRWTAYPQKMVPAALALYWLARMWTVIDDSAWGKTWIVWCTTLLVLLMLLQVRIGYKLHGGALPPRRGPVMRLLLLPFTRRTQRNSSTVYRDSLTPVPASAAAAPEADKLRAEGISFEKVASARRPAEVAEDVLLQNEGLRTLESAIEAEERPLLPSLSYGPPSSYLSPYPPSTVSSSADYRPLSLINTDDFGTSLELEELERVGEEMRRRRASEARPKIALC